MQNFKTSDKPVPWKTATTERMASDDRAALAAGATAKRHDAEQKREQAASLASQKAIEIIATATPATTSHAYLTAKQVSSKGLFIAPPGASVETEDGREIDIAGRLLVPIRAMNGTIISLQIIDDAGRKMFMPGGKVSGGSHVIGDLKSPWPVHVVEGYATGATVHEATGHPVVVAFAAKNLGPVAAQLRAENPERSIFISGDNDHHLPLQNDAQGRPKPNVGLEAAKAAAKAVDGHALIPAFEHGDSGSDWNDAMRQRGKSAVQGELAVGLATGARIKIAADLANKRGYGRSEEIARGRETVGIER
jgi:putative DNA primase/helicase